MSLLKIFQAAIFSIIGAIIFSFFVYNASLQCPTGKFAQAIFIGFPTGGVIGFILFKLCYYKLSLVNILSTILAIILSYLAYNILWMPIFQNVLKIMPGALDIILLILVPYIVAVLSYVIVYIVYYNLKGKDS